jgi:hypothetical protein
MALSNSIKIPLSGRHGYEFPKPRLAAIFMVNVPLTISPEEWRLCKPIEANCMSKFVLGETVIDEKGRGGIVRAAYLSREGQQHYAVEMNGVVHFMEEGRLTKYQAGELAVIRAAHASGSVQMSSAL